MSRPTVTEILAAKRDGHRHSRADIEGLIDSFVSGAMPDYQMSAWLMAALINGLDDEETVDLTRAMALSGETVDLSSIPGLKADKHSTGGVGDKTTLVLVPMVASVGVPIAKMSGRGLGHTGGTLDKLEAIPGFKIEMTIEDFVSQVSSVGCAVIAGRADIDPADKKMYALRDVTATVPSIPLIVGSIISKKVAGGADVIVLDVKVGSGAFMKTDEEARTLADALTRTGEALGRTVSCVLTDMDRPLGRAIGNALEVREALETLSGGGPADLRRLCLALGAKMVVGAGVAPDEHSATRMLERSLDDGSSMETFRSWVQAQGGEPQVVDDPGLLPSASLTREVLWDSSGVVTGFDAEGIGRAAMVMGAGRAATGDDIDLGAGIVLDVTLGEKVEPGERIAVLHAATETALDEGEGRLREAIGLGEEATPPRPLIRDA